MEELSASPLGQLVPIAGFDPRHDAEYGHVAFLPACLPEDVALDQGTWKAVVAATQALGRLDQAGVALPNPHLLRRPLLRREAVTTSALEGTYAALADVVEAEVDERPRSAELREVLNYVRAAEHAIDALRAGRPISLGLLCEAHRLLVAGTAADGPDAGRIRTTPVVIGPPGCAVAEARFVPAPPDDRLHGGMRAWEAWLSRPRDLPVLVQAAMAHYQLEALHPFNDGNGRLGRLAVLLGLLASGELRHPLLDISAWLEPRRRAYHDHLFELSRSGEWGPWVAFFAGAVGAQATRTVARIDELLAEATRIREMIRAQRVRGVALDIAEDLLAQPIVGPTWAAKTHGVSYPSANAAMARLVEVGILVEITGRRYGRLFAAPELLAILERR